jgi:hypothetical protein
VLGPTPLGLNSNLDYNIIRGGSFGHKIESASPAQLSGLIPGISYCSVESAVS